MTGALKEPCYHCGHLKDMHAAGNRGYCSICACKGFGTPSSELGPDAPTVANAQGGKQSDLHYRFDLMDPQAMFALAGILDHGERKYGAGNWTLIDARSHCNHALVHLYAYLDGNTEDDHLGHAFTRLMMAFATDRRHDPPKDATREALRRLTEAVRGGVPKRSVVSAYAPERELGQAFLAALEVLGQ